MCIAGRVVKIFLLFSQPSTRSQIKKIPQHRERFGFMLGDHSVVAAPTTESLVAGSESLARPVRSRSSWWLLAALYTAALAAVAHTCYFSHCPPLVREAMLQVSYL